MCFFNEKFIIFIITAYIFSQLGLQKKNHLFMLRIESSSVWTQLFVICNFRVCMSFLVVIHVCLYVALLVIMLTYLLGGVLTCQFLLFNMWRKVIYGHELQLLNYYVESSVSTWFVCCSCCFLLYPC